MAQGKRKRLRTRRGQMAEGRDENREYKMGNEEEEEVTEGTYRPWEVALIEGKM